jgi:uncharacterized metal-binding protein YceD (DUF177 family)
MTEHPSEHPWSAPVRLDEVPESGRHVVLEASPAVCAAVAKAANVVAVETLSVALDLTRRGRDGVRAAGSVRARVRQICVVSLEPMVSTVDETIDVSFAPAREPAAKSKARMDDDAELVAVDPGGEEPPESVMNGTIDLGALATEFLILGIDPYPRKEGVAFEAPVAGDDSAAHPFAALAALKKASKVKD